MQQKTFYKTLLEFSLNPAKAKQCLTDKRLTMAEKKIIEGLLLIRNNQNQQALDLMREIPPSALAFVEGQRKLVTGLALNNLSIFGEAEQIIKESLVLLEQLQVPYFQFIAHLYLYTIYSNKNQLNLMKKSLQMMESIPQASELQKIKLLRCQFDYFAQVDEKKARQVLSEIEVLKGAMAEGDIITHLVCEFMFFVRCEEFDRCEKILGQMKNYRKFNLTENFNFMKMLLNHLNKNTPIYFYGDDFKSIPLLYFQLKVIHALEEKNTSEALKCWMELHSLYPEIYLPDFNYAGSKCLFSLCLKKHQASLKETVHSEKSQNASKLSLLVNFLLAARTPISKGYLYEYLWDCPPEDKADMVKLTKLISRARSERGIEIKSRKGTYFIEQVPQKRTKVS